VDSLKTLENLIKSKKTIALLAPSFVANFKYPQLIYTLRAIGFDKVVELTYGAKMVNINYYKYLRNNLTKTDKTYIPSPCPTLVQLIRTKFPHLLENLVPIHSPMGAMALICNKHFPGHSKIFIGPCFTKKIEAQEIKTVDLVITFVELAQYIEKTKPVVLKKHCYSFDKFYNDYTKIYPISGGLSATLHHSKILKDEDIFIADGLKTILPVLSSFVNGRYKNYRFLDILACDGGCIGGPGMIDNIPIPERRKKVEKYCKWAKSSENDCGRTGLKIHSKGLDFKRKF